MDTSSLKHLIIVMKVKGLLSIILIGLTVVATGQTMDAEQIYKKVNGAVVQIYAYDS